MNSIFHNSSSSSSSRKSIDKIEIFISVEEDKYFLGVMFSDGRYRRKLLLSNRFYRRSTSILRKSFLPTSFNYHTMVPSLRITSTIRYFRSIKKNLLINFNSFYASCRWFIQLILDIERYSRERTLPNFFYVSNREKKREKEKETWKEISETNRT